jgi:hypothetical protein
MRRSRFRSRFRTSGLGYRGSYGRGVPLKGPIAIIFSIGMLLFFVSFVLNFVLMFAMDDYFESFGMIFFFIPFGIMAILVPTMIIASIVQAFKVMKNPQAFANEQMAQGFGQTVNVASLAQQAGYQVNQLPSNDPSTAQYLLESDQRKILVKVLTPGQTYRNGIVQDLSKGLGQYLAQEAWVIQTPPTFTDNDLNFARFYNVKLLNQVELSKLLPIQTKDSSTKF